jgi:uncharacterized membrane protein
MMRLPIGGFIMISSSYRTRRRVGQIANALCGVLLILAAIMAITLIVLAVTSSQFWNSSP